MLNEKRQPEVTKPYVNYQEVDIQILIKTFGKQTSGADMKH